MFNTIASHWFAIWLARALALRNASESCVIRSHPSNVTWYKQYSKRRWAIESRSRILRLRDACADQVERAVPWSAKDRTCFAPINRFLHTTLRLVFDLQLEKFFLRRFMWTKLAQEISLIWLQHHCRMFVKASASLDILCCSSHCRCFNLWVTRTLHIFIVQAIMERVCTGERNAVLEDLSFSPW